MIIRCNIDNKQKIDIEITDLSGKNIVTRIFQPDTSGEQQIYLRLPDLTQAYYLINLKQGDRIIGNVKFAVQNK
jgi:hypothetical protein